MQRRLQIHKTGQWQINNCSCIKKLGQWHFSNMISGMVLSDSSSCAPGAQDDWGDDQGMIFKVSDSKDGDDWGTILKVSGSKSGRQRGRWGGSQARGECHGVCPENIPTDIGIINRLWLWLAETWIHQLWLMNILATQHTYALCLLNHRDGLISDGLTKKILH